MDLSLIAIVIQLIFLECILSLDNAAVLGAMVSPLSDTVSIPWPKSLAPFSHSLDKVMGNQRTGALRVGLIMAYVLRGAMLFAASFIIHNPWLKVVGALYLVRLAMEDLSSGSMEDDEDGDNKVRERGFWMTVLVVNLMDMAFSIDNVVAAVSLSDKFWVVIIGVFIGILVMRFAAGIFSHIVEKEPVLKTAAYILVLNIGIELLIEEFPLDRLAHPPVLNSFWQHFLAIEGNHIAIGDWTRFGISILTILLVLAYAHFKPVRVIRPLLIWIVQGLTVVNSAITWALAPIKGIINLFIRLIRAIFTRKQPQDTTG